MKKFKCLVCEKDFLKDWKRKDTPKYCSRICYGIKRDEKYKHLIGKKIGKLTIISISEIRSKRGHVCLKCKCECGNEKIYSAHHIEGLECVSCGCWKSRKKTTINNFLDKIEKTNNCWIWKGQINKAGYGRYQQKYAHRLSYEYHKGKIPKDKMICHKCNNKLCVNPDHMYLGTAYDNAQDAIKCGVLLGRNTRKKS